MPPSRSGTATPPATTPASAAPSPPCRASRQAPAPATRRPVGLRPALRAVPHLADPVGRREEAHHPAAQAVPAGLQGQVAVDRSRAAAPRCATPPPTTWCSCAAARYPTLPAT